MRYCNSSLVFLERHRVNRRFFAAETIEANAFIHIDATKLIVRSFNTTYMQKVQPVTFSPSAVIEANVHALYIPPFVDEQQC